MINYRVFIDNGFCCKNYEFDLKLPFKVEKGHIFENVFHEEVQVEEGGDYQIEPIHKEFKVNKIKTFIYDDFSYEVQLYCTFVE